MRAYLATLVHRSLADSQARDRRISRKSRRTHMAEPLESRVLLSAALVKNINTTPALYSVRDFAQAGGALWFLADDANKGTQLWKTDGTTAGTMEVKGIIPEVPGEAPTELLGFRGMLYFLARTTAVGGDDGLWKSDGTPGGTSEIASIYLPEMLTATDDAIYLAGWENPRRDWYDVWKSDGTATNYIWGDWEGAALSFSTAGSSFYFQANTDLFKNDATGTTRVGTAYSQSIASAGDRVFMAAYKSLYAAGGGLTGVQRVHDFSDILSIGGAGYQGSIYFKANDAAVGAGLWKSDGTDAGTVLVSSAVDPVGGYTEFNGKLYFAGNDAAHGTELWQTDGTPGGTRLVVDLNPGTGSGVTSDPSGVFNGALYFLGTDGKNGSMLWRSDGTVTGTMPVHAFGTADAGSKMGGSQFSWMISSGLNVTVNGVTYFRADDGVHGVELWKTDGTTAGTTLVSDIRLGSGSSYPKDLIEFNGAVYFNADDGTTGRDSFWRTDGTAAGTVRLIDGPEYGHLGANGLLYIDIDGGGDHVLWRTDGTAAGTLRLTETSTAAGMATVGGTLYFNYRGATASKSQLYKTDGTVAGTVSLTSDKPVETSWNTCMANLNGRLYFSARDAADKPVIWQTDGTTGGTTAVYGLPSTSQFIESVNVVGGKLYFSVLDTSTNHYSLEWIDGSGSPSTTVWSGDRKLVYSDQLHALGNTLYFAAGPSPTSTDYVIYHTDGTLAGTVALATVRALGSFASAGDKVYFTAVGDVGGYALYSTDGTPTGTRRISSGLPGGLVNNGLGLLPVDTHLYFIANDGIHGNQLWQTDGTTTALADPGETVAGWTADLLLGNSANGIVFAASDPQHGSELWNLPPAPPPVFGPPAALVDAVQPIQQPGSNSVTFTVTYSDVNQIDAGTLGNGNLTVKTPAGAVVSASVFGSRPANADSVRVTYSIPAPSGAQSAADNGTYTVTATSTAASAVKNLKGVALAGGTIGSFAIDWPAARVTAMQPVQTAGAATITFTVTFSDSRLIIAGTLGNGNLSVKLPGGSVVPATLVSSNLANATSITVTYSIPAPSGALSAGDNGTYTVTATSVSAAAVRNVNGVPLPGGNIGTLLVGAPAGTMSGSQPAQSSGSPTIAFMVIYSDLLQVNTATLGNGNLAVTAPDGSTRVVTFVGFSSVDAHTVRATYSIPAPFGMLSDLDNGTYTVSTTADSAAAVKNVGGVALPAGQVGTFAVQVPTSSSGPNLLAVSIAGRLPAAAVAGSAIKGGLSVMIRNTGDQTASGPILIYIYASTDPSLWANATVVGTITRTINLRPGKSQKITIPKINWPSGLNGSYYLVAHVNAARGFGEASFVDNLRWTASSVLVAPPVVDLKNLWSGTLPKIAAGKRVTFSVPVKNEGNVTARGTVTVKVRASPTGSATDAVTLGAPGVRVNIPPGKTQKLSAKLTMPTLASGNYHVLLTLGTLSNDGSAGETVVSSLAFTV